MAIACGGGWPSYYGGLGLACQCQCSISHIQSSLRQQVKLDLFYVSVTCLMVEVRTKEDP